VSTQPYRSNPELVSKMVDANIEGLHQGGIISCIKHFPGHGDTKGDTHDGYVSINKTWNELKTCELVPFIHALSITDMVMLSHITTPNITTDGLPASLSYEMIQGKLRDELGYDGVIITDSLAMGAITKEYSSAESAVKAITAGVDILLMPENYIEAYDSIFQAVENGTIEESRIDESVLRILTLKLYYDFM
jgi:beta-N-acetylhexosaminidase